MKILFIDTSSFNVTISYIEDNVIKFIFNDEIRDDMSSKIMPIIRDGSIESSIELSDLDRIIVCNGPGSFTGIRIGVTIAKTIAWALKKDIITISTLELYASTSFDTKYIIPMINARRGYVYSGIYDKECNWWHEYTEPCPKIKDVVKFQRKMNAQLKRAAEHKKNKNTMIVEQRKNTEPEMER